jgi:hypothetical protein
MTRDFADIRDNLDQVYRLQERQIGELLHEPIPDIAGHARERQIAFEALGVRLESFLAGTTDGAGRENRAAAARDLEQCRTRVTDLLRQNQELKNLITDYKATVQQAMTKLNQGKRVLHSYRKGLSPSPAPKVMSLNS